GRGSPKPDRLREAHRRPFRAARCSAAFSFASAYDFSTSDLPSVQPNAHVTRTSPTRMFHAVMISCWLTENAVAFALDVTPWSEATLKACVTPAPPGVTEVTFAIEFPATTRINVSNVTGIVYAARNAAITHSIATQLITPGTNTRTTYARRWPTI